jgi:hypothetical protein
VGRWLTLIAFVIPAAGANEDPPLKVDFTRDIRPILANNCLLCHGPDPKARKGDLRLDTREGAMADLGGHAALVPGKPEASELVKRVTAADPEELMPPLKSGKKLSPREVELLRRWIAEGAVYSKHWAFVKPVRPALPAVKDAAWVRNEVDRFVLARLEKEGLRPSPEADRSALARRLSLDLVGLPPDAAEVERFVADRDPEAVAAYVDRLLASPAFGERWAKMWLDLARYADSQGYAEDRPRVIWGFRDWVIRAFNENLPFDRFTVDQLAGDLLPGATEAQIHATAFHRNTLTNTEGGTDDEEFRNNAIVDRVNTTMQVWMGLTMACVQCHNHKYDPIYQEEYYQVFSFFNQTEDNDAPDDRPTVPIFTDEQKRQKKDLEEGLARLEEEFRKPSPEIDAARKRWEGALGRPLPWKPAGGGDVGGGTSLKLAPEAKFVAALRIEVEGKEPGLTRVSAALSGGPSKAPAARFVRVELPGSQRYLHLAEVQVFSGGGNIAPQGKAVQSSTDFDGPANLANDGNTNGDYNAKSVTHTKAEDNPWWEIDLGRLQPVERVAVWNRTDGGAPILERMKGVRLKLLDEARKVVEERKLDAHPNPTWTLSFDGAKELAFRGAYADSEKSPAKGLLEGKGWSAQADGKAHEVALILDRPAGGEIVLRLEAKSPVKVKVSVLEAAADAAVLEVPADVRAAAGKDAARVDAYYRTVAPELADLRGKLAAARKQVQDFKPLGTLPVLRELPEGRRRKTYIQLRGNFLARGAEVKEGVPAVLHPLPVGAPRSRLGFAQWLVSPENPLTARVAVNRLWEQVFGAGLMATSEDWGLRGEFPSHPELVEWLAVEYVESGWDTKRMLKLLATSAAYRQSSAVTPELLQKDPVNRLLTRGPRVRLSAEAVRDQALAVGGLLSRKIGGPSVYPVQPKTGLSAAFSSSTDWEPSKGEDRHRRGIYTFWRRSVPYPSMATFDAPDRNVCTVKRVPTNTPLQALVTMNDPVYVEAAQSLARKAVAEGGKTDAERIDWMFRRGLARPVRDAESKRLLALLAEAKSKYAADAAKAKAMATEPLGPLPAGADAAELAAWTVVGNVFLNLDEMFLKR